MRFVWQIDCRVKQRHKLRSKRGGIITHIRHLLRVFYLYIRIWRLSLQLLLTTRYSLNMFKVGYLSVLYIELSSIICLINLCNMLLQILWAILVYTYWMYWIRLVFCKVIYVYSYNVVILKLWTFFQFKAFIMVSAC